MQKSCLNSSIDYLKVTFFYEQRSNFVPEVLSFERNDMLRKGDWRVALEDIWGQALKALITRNWLKIIIVLRSNQYVFRFTHVELKLLH